MTSLTCLELYNAPFLRANGLEQLTQLSRLRALKVEGVGAKRGAAFTLDNTVRGVGQLANLPCAMSPSAGTVLGQPCVCNIMPVAGGFYGRTVHARLLLCLLLVLMVCVACPRKQGP